VSAFHFVLFLFLFFVFVFLIHNNNISYSGGQLDGPVAFLTACPYIILYSFVIFYVFLANKDACLLAKAKTFLECWSILDLENGVNTEDEILY